MNTMASPMLPAQPTTKNSFRLWAWVLSFSIPLLAGTAWTGALYQPGEFLGTLLGFQLLLLLLVATVTDLYDRKIYNFSTGSALLLAWGANFASSANLIAMEHLGAVGLLSSVSGAVACFLIVFLAFQMTGCGAGDVKMATVIGALLGIHVGLSAVAYSYILASVVAVGITGWSIGPRRFFRAQWFAFAKLCRLQVALKTVPPNDLKTLQSTIPMAPFFAIGTLLALWEIT